MTLKTKAAALAAFLALTAGGAYAADSMKDCCKDCCKDKPAAAPAEHKH